MFDRSSAALFLLTCVALAVTPGPDMLLSLSRSLAQGSRAGIVSALGSAAGFYVHAVAAALGLSGAFAYVPAAYDAVRYAGALYLAFLAWQLLRSGAVLPVSPARVGPASLSRIFRQAFLVNLLNPKAILFFIALFPQFLQGDGTAPERLHDDLADFRTWDEVVREAQKGTDPKLTMISNRGTQIWPSGSTWR